MHEEGHSFAVHFKAAEMLDASKASEGAPGAQVPSLLPDRSSRPGAASRLPTWLCRVPLSHAVQFSSVAKCVR